MEWATQNKLFSLLFVIYYKLNIPLSYKAFIHVYHTMSSGNQTTYEHENDPTMLSEIEEEK